MMRKLSLLLALLLLAGCGQPAASDPDGTVSSEKWTDAVRVELSDEAVTVNGETAPTEPSAAVYTANDIVYYEEGKDFTYGEGTEADAHSADEAAAHTVVHITQPGRYVLSGKLSAGQVAVDLGEDAEDDPNAVVTLILDGADVTCTVAPAVIFYNVYECGDKDNPTQTVDTAAAGANVIIGDETVNNISGSYVARIYEPDSVELSDDGTAVEDASKLHKYDGAFYSKMSMNISGDAVGDGVLNVFAENEGLGSEMHLTVNGGVIGIVSGNDGINTNEDGVSVTTINGGSLAIAVSGETGEGDGIDSNGWLVINGGQVIAQACSDSADAGIDSDMGIHINGGTVVASGHMLDRIEDGGQTYAVFSFAQRQAGRTEYALKSAAGDFAADMTPENDFTVLLYSSPDLAEGDHTFWQGEMRLEAVAGMGGQRPSGTGGPQLPEDWEGFDPSDLPQIPMEGERPAEMPEGMESPEGMPEMPEGMEPPALSGAEPPEDMGARPQPGGGQGFGAQGGEAVTTFAIVEGANYFANVGPVA